jgi:hypothetical protein
MEDVNKKLKRTTNPALNESKLITNQITKKIYKNYKTTPHTSISEEDANDNISDLVSIQEIIHRIIIRRNNSYI